jgi:N-acetylglutamate synthase-like GNAT family acetyltransferase
LERGFKQAEVSALPSEKQTLYNWQRNAKVYLRPVITP